MQRNSEFQRLLNIGIRQAALAAGNKPIGAFTDELAYALGVTSHAINYWKKGYPPAGGDDLLSLTKELLSRKGLNLHGCIRLVTCAGHPEFEAKVRQNVHLESEPQSDPPLHPQRVKEMESTFVSGPAIFDPRQFFGRTYELKRIFRDWTANTMMHTWVVGKNRTGKTSLLHYLRRAHLLSPADLRPTQVRSPLKQPDQFRFVHIDFHDGRMHSLPRVLRHLLDGFGLTATTEPTIEEFLDSMQSYDWCRPVVLTADELDLGLGSKDLPLAFWDALRSLAATYCNGKLSMVFASHEPFDLAVRHATKASPLNNIFDNLFLKPFTEAESRELIASSPIPFDEVDVSYILDRSKGWPCAVQALCKERLNALQDNDQTDAWRARGEDALAAFRHLLEEP